MKRAGGSFGSRNGARWTQSGATDRRRTEARRLAHGTASLPEAASPPSQEALRRCIEANECPFCGSGPYRSLGLHTYKAHGVGAAELRAMSGLKVICSEDLSAGSRERLEQRPDRAEISARGTEAAVERGAQAIAKAAWQAKALALRAERDPIIVARALSGDRLTDIAADLGTTLGNVGKTLSRLGVQPTLEQTNAERRQRLAATSAQALATFRRNRATRTATRVARYKDLGGDWAAVEELAGECRMSERAMRQFLRDHGVDVPDGRAVSPRRPTERPAARGKPNRGARSVTDEQMAEIRRLAAETDLSQQQIGARFGVSQSIVSRVVLRKYVEPDAG